MISGGTVWATGAERAGCCGAAPCVGPVAAGAGAAGWAGGALAGAVVCFMARVSEAALSVVAGDGAAGCVGGSPGRVTDSDGRIEAVVDFAGAAEDVLDGV